MRALTRMRTLAAACALLLFVAGMVAAGPLDRQIDRPGVDVRPPTTEAGEPDSGHELVAVLGTYVFVIRLPGHFTRAFSLGSFWLLPRITRGPTR